jgi:hypothetical protein
MDLPLIIRAGLLALLDKISNILSINTQVLQRNIITSEQQLNQSQMRKTLATLLVASLFAGQSTVAAADSRSQQTIKNKLAIAKQQQQKVNNLAQVRTEDWET